MTRPQFKHADPHPGLAFFDLNAGSGRGELLKVSGTALCLHCGALAEGQYHFWPTARGKKLAQAQALRALSYIRCFSPADPIDVMIEEADDSLSGADPWGDPY